MKKRKKLLQQVKYTSSNELYIVDSKGCLIKLKCPFIVEAAETVFGIQNGLKYEVLSINISINLETVYEIANHYYSYRAFVIL